MITLFEQYNNTQYVIICNLLESHFIMVLVSLKNSNKFIYADEYSDKDNLTYYTIDDAKLKVERYTKQNSDYDFKYISIDEFKQLIEDIKIQKDSKKYNL